MTDEVRTLDSQALSPSPIFRGAHMVRALADYRDLQKALDDSMPDQLMTISGKSFRKKGYWRAIAVAFGLTVELVSEERSVIGVLEDGSENYLYSASYRAVAPNGRSTVGDGTCTAAEKHRGRMEATEHNVRSHASTRAFNRAVSNLVGFGEVSAEEVERDEHGGQAAAVSTRPDGSTLIVTVEEKSGTGKGGKTWTRYLVTCEDGRSGSTFDVKLVAEARQLAAVKTPVIVTFLKSGDFMNLDSIEVAAPISSRAAEAPASTVLTDPDAAVISEAQVKRLWEIARTHGFDTEGVRALLKPLGYERVAYKDETTGVLTIFIKRKDYEAIVDALKKRPGAAAMEPRQEG